MSQNSYVSSDAVLLPVVAAGWFLESLLTQTFVTHSLRTERIPFFQSNASLLVYLSTFTVMIIGMALPYTPLRDSMNFVRVPASYYGFLALYVCCYLILVQCAKTAYKKVFGHWL